MEEQKAAPAGTGAPPVRVLQVVDSLHPGGMENIVVQVANCLHGDGFEFAVCCLNTEGPFAERLSPSVARMALQKGPGFRWSAVARLRRLMRRGFDVVHTHHLGGLIYAVLARGLSARPKIVHSEHIILDGWELHWKRHWQRRVLYRRAACVFTVSQQQLQQLRDHGQWHRWMFTLPNGVDCNRFQPPAEGKDAVRRKLGLEPEAFWIGKVARFATPKRHLDLIAAFEEAAREVPALRLLLVGDGGIEKDTVLARIAQSPFREKIHWAGLQQDAAPWYQAMDALVIASVSEGLPNAALEGMACGLPLLCNDVCGIREVAIPEDHGWIENLSTVPLLAAGIERVALRPPADLQRMGSKAREHVLRHFSVEAMMKRYRDLYASVAAAA